MAEIGPLGSVPGRADGARARVRGRGTTSHPVLALRRPFAGPLPDSSVGAVRKVARLDGRTHVVAAREPGGNWYRLLHRTRFTRENAQRLREAGVSEVVLRRGFGRASFPLGWLRSNSP